ncbi:hypothetical protein CLTEP_14220 [Clostridium tepidiprofundi DSM 19306]|uniref:Integral membrane protein n=1 Tax=Clostridium tepidiprofundi DSM 19306 TaxID=1121338 RepID=A0A151B3U4_9CLOT|nr:TIGR01906 family membrane protein [Clostridium tepidiprofundi]KYH34594.1 hypothetical protein CLTEP_14220 [Clostridium tepidiprofundi DSM 19306]
MSRNILNIILNGIFNFVFIIAFCLLIIILSVKFTVHFKPLYYHDINKLNIESVSDLSRNEIINNYNYLVNFISSPENNINFKIPSFSDSTEGIIHFYEVKSIFNKLNYIFYSCLLISVIGILLKIKRHDYVFLKLCSIILISSQIIILLPIIIDFNKSFTYFHKILFNNDYWLFNEKTDPVIKILPEPFFFHCVLLFIGIITTMSCILAIVFLKLNSPKNKTNTALRKKILIKRLLNTK